MAYQDISQVTIALQGVGVTAQGFGIPLFASSHRYFPERVRAYSSITEAANDLPAESTAFKAVQAFLSNTPRPTTVKIGRQEADISISVATGATSASFTLTVKENTTQYVVPISVTGQADEDAVASALASAIEADSDIGDLLVATSTGEVLEIDVASSAVTFGVTKMSDDLTDSYTTTETATQLLAALTAEDDDYYFIAAEDHSETFVLAMAAAVEARTKMYFFSTSDVQSLGSYAEGSATDLLGKISDAGYNRTKGMYHNQADSIFPECTYIGYNAPFSAGSVTWTNIVAAIPTSQNATTGIALSSTEKGNLEDRESAYVDLIGGVNVIRNGNVASGEKIDSIRGRDNLTIDLDTEYTNFLLSQQGGKLPYTDGGIGQLEGICRNVLARYAIRGFINDNYTTTFPRENQVPTADKANRIYQLGRFEAELSGAIEIVRLNGVLSLNL